MICQIETIPEFEVLYNSKHPNYFSRYIVFYGGRGGRKSWEYAKKCLMEALKSKKLIVCTREHQNSISDSVHRLLSDRIEDLDLQHEFEVQKNTIIAHRTGSEFIFKGLSGLTIDAIKSLEGADLCWVEEAHSVSDKSWSILIPTIRKKGSQILVSYNPDLNTDPAHQRFVINPPPNAFVQKVTYLDNPDCPQTLIDEANYLREVDYEAYAHVYLGEVREYSDAQVFKDKYTIQSFEIDSTFDAPLQGADWGFANDPNTLIRSYIKDNCLYICNEAYKVKCEIEDTPGMFDSINDARNYMIVADNARPEIISFMQRKGFKIKPAQKWKGCEKDAIDFMRSFEKIIVHPDCKHTAEEMRLYCYKIDKRTGNVLPELVDKHNHCIRAIGYSLESFIKKRSISFNLSY